MSDYYRCYAKIDLSAVRHNILAVKEKLKNEKLLVVVKANAYGHGAFEVADAINDLADYYAVATIEEAVDLREQGVNLPILILGYTSPNQYEDLFHYDLTQTIYNLENAEQLQALACKMKKKIRVHIALDTGMTRIGFQISEEEADRIEKICQMDGIEVEGAFSHFACADMIDKSYCAMQLEKFDRMFDMLKARGIEIPIRHIHNSAGVMEFEGPYYEMVRSGIVTYGLYPSEEVKKENLDLIPALSWYCHVVHVKEVEEGRGVSYGATFVTKKPITRIATISAGYADGYPRALSSKGRVLIHGQFAPILGRVCMDQIMVDVSEIDDVKVEDLVTLIGTDGEKMIPVEEVADPAGRFNYEMVCSISPRVPRIYIDISRKEDTNEHNR